MEPPKKKIFLEKKKVIRVKFLLQLYIFITWNDSQKIIWNLTNY